jgi:hypothetical protein
MKDKRVVVSFAAGVVVAAALGGIYFWFQDVRPTASHLAEVIRPTAGDDDRVVVAGGSLKISSDYGFDMDNPNDHQTANHRDKGRTVNRLEIWSDNNAARTDQFFPSGQVDVDFEYCPDDCSDGSKKHDHVTITAPGGKKLKVSNSDGVHPIGDEAHLNPLLIDHQPNQPGPPKQGTVTQIKISGKLGHTPQPSYACAANGKCHVVVHYWCPSTVEGACKN